MTKRNSTDAPASNQAKNNSTRKLTTADFIARAKSVHGNTYDYSRTVYINSRVKVNVTCRKHGEFTQSPILHSKGQGCPTCGVEQRVKKRAMGGVKFIAEAKLIHGDKFLYDKVVYKNNIDPVVITCRTHGDFKQAPKSHLRGFGCKHCSGKSRYTSRSFAIKGRQKHGDKYDYSRVECSSSADIVEIGCPIHGFFEQRAISHIQGHGCAKCGRDSAREYTGKGTDGFIKEALEVHGSTYKYSKVEYKNKAEKVIITCSEHGDFEQIAADHLAGHGCAKCGKLAAAKLISLTQADFVKRAKDTHGGRYEYSKVKYRSVDKKVVITCTEHGDFKQRPKNHMKGEGCPKCGAENSSFGFGLKEFTDACSRNMNGSGVLYVIKCYGSGEDFYKVGITSKGVGLRFQTVRAMPYQYETVFSITESAEYVYRLESSLHRMLRSEKYRPQISFGGETECFTTIKPVEKLLKELSTTEQLQLLA